MKFGIFAFFAVLGLVVGSATFAATPSLDNQDAIAIANTVAKHNHVDLSEYQPASPQQRDDGNWFIFYQHKRRYGLDQFGKLRPFYPPDDCFWVTVNATTKKAEFSGCG